MVLIKLLWRIFSISAVFLFVFLNFVNPNFLNIQETDAEAGGLGVTFSSPSAATIYNVSHEPGSLSATFKVFHCNNGGSAPCADNFGLADYDSAGSTSQGVTIDVPAKGGQGNMSFSASSFSCGRIQVDLGSSEGVYGGWVFPMGGDCNSTPPAPAPPAQPAQQTYGPLNPTASASCVNGSEDIVANWSNVGAASYQATLAVNGNTIAASCLNGTSKDFGPYPHRTDASYVVTVFAYTNSDCSGSSPKSDSYGVSQACPNPQPQEPQPAQPVQTQAPQCPTAGQAGTRLLYGCFDSNGNTQYGYDSCTPIYSYGSIAGYNCTYSQNNNCQGTIYCTQQQANNQCRSISCSSAPADCYYQNRLTYTCNPYESLTCGTLVCNQTAGNPTCSISPSPQSGNSPLNVSFTGNGYGGSGSINSYSWDLDGNGSYGDASGQSASRVYTSSANINLAVTDSAGRIGYCSSSINITTPPPASQGSPVCTLSLSTGSTNVGSNMTFNANFNSNGTGRSAGKYVFSFGDGNTQDAGGSSSVTGAYASAGFYYPSVLITDNTGAQTSCSSSVNIVSQGNAPQVYQTFANVGVGTSAPVPVYYANVKQLPRTGLPLLAWAAAAFIPVGFRLRKLGSLKKELEGDPNFIWEDRHFKSGS